MIFTPFSEHDLKRYNWLVAYAPSGKWIIVCLEDIEQSTQASSESLRLMFLEEARAGREGINYCLGARCQHGYLYTTQRHALRHAEKLAEISFVADTGPENGSRNKQLIELNEEYEKLAATKDVELVLTNEVKESNDTPTADSP